MIDVAPESEFGGNSRYTAGAMRFAYDHGDDLALLLEGSTDERLPHTDFGSYPKSQFLADLEGFNGDQAITPAQRKLVDESQSLMLWLRASGICFEPIYSRQAFEKNGRFQFWGGLTLAARGEGDGLVQHQRELFLGLGGTIRYATEARELLHEGGRVTGVRVAASADGGNEQDLRADAVVLACGGFEANAARRAELMGTSWRHARVRGSRYNQGHGITMACRVGAARAGKFDGAHATPMDLHTPDYGNPDMPHLDRKNYRKISYPFGVMLNAHGQRFVDEGADFRNYTYAQYGRAILEQPNHMAWQIFDAQVLDLLYEEYRVDFATRVSAETLESLVEQLDGIDSAAALATLNAFNAAVDTRTPFDPTVKDGRATRGLALEKSNWANRLERAPFVAYPVTCGITFTYGGLRVALDGAVCDAEGSPIPGLFACGELVGDVFFEGYPGGSGLTSGGVFGRAAGAAASA